ncbi:MAG TPA: alpha/beta hydrolase-fold protein [Solirubrobacteraceae bacterium]|nr:alpha/beta hydrolase-fold protein [Solirubrobacteraceae bacterium]
MSNLSTRSTAGVSRRRFLAAGAGGVLLAGAAGVELVAHGVLPGQHYLDQIDGACSVAPPPERYGSVGPTVVGSFFSQARRRQVSFTLAYPPEYGPGSRLPLVVYLYGNGGSHTSPLGALPLAKALAGHTKTGGIPPMALVVADGGSLYWNPHPGDDPMRMITDELVPRLRARGLGAGARSLGIIGMSMGGYGALLLSEKRPDLFSAAAAISPAIWTSYAEARAANPAAFASASDFARDDVITHAGRLAGIPVRIASGASDPFHPGVLALAPHLPASASLQIPPGCHNTSFFSEQQLPSLQFLGRHLSA